MPQPLNISIIGHGRFGTFLEKLITKHLPNAKFTDVNNADIIIPSVPISAFKQVILKIKDEIKPGAIIIEVCSVKTYPANILKKHIPKEVFAISTHPMFGPDSANTSLVGHKIVVHNINAPPKTYSKFKQFCKKLGLEVIEMTPEKHDKIMAYSQAYTHLLGRMGEGMHLKSTKLDTKGFTQTLKIQQYVVNDKEQLFLDMHKYNPYTAKMRKKVLKTLQTLDKKINSS